MGIMFMGLKKKTTYPARIKAVASVYRVRRFMRLARIGNVTYPMSWATPSTAANGEYMLSSR